MPGRNRGAVITYTVYEQPNAPADRLDRAQALEFVREGFRWTAALVTPLWLIAKRLWLVLVFYLAALGLLQAAAWSLELDQRSMSYVVIALHLIIGFEADTLQRWTLERRGWTLVGSVNGRNAEDCERRFFEAWLPGQPFVHPSALSQSRLSAQADPVPFSGKAADADQGASSAGGRWRSAFAFGKRS